MYWIEIEFNWNELGSKSPEVTTNITRDIDLSLIRGKHQINCDRCMYLVCTYTDWSCSIYNKVSGLLRNLQVIPTIAGKLDKIDIFLI